MPTLADQKSEAAKAEGKKPDQFLDLMVMVHPRELDKAAVRSLLADAVAAPAPKATDAAATADSQKGREELTASLEAARKQNPDDLSLAIAEALLALAGDDSARIEPALDRLNELVDKSPLEPLADGVRANARQRAQAARQVPLWLVARACWKRKDAVKLPGFADKLAARARDAARRQTENAALLAMIREEGELALERGDRAAAEAAWSRMLELVVEPADRKARRNRAHQRPAPAGIAPVPAAGARSDRRHLDGPRDAAIAHPPWRRFRPPRSRRRPKAAPRLPSLPATTKRRPGRAGARHRAPICRS